MKSRILVENRQEADLLRGGLEDRTVRAFVKVMGALGRLPSDAARRRVLTYVADREAERRALLGNAQAL